MKWTEVPRTMDELWEAVDGACRWRGIYWGFMGVSVHSGAGWQATAFGADEHEGQAHYITGKGPTPRAAMIGLLRGSRKGLDSGRSTTRS